VIAALTVVQGMLWADDLERKPMLSRWNPEVPFCYVHGASRRWPILEREMPEGTEIALTAKRGNETLAEGTTLQFSGFQTSLSKEGMLEIVSSASEAAPPFSLHMQLKPPNGPSESQELEVRPAPSNRPISYCADLVDDIIRIFSNYRTGEFREITKAGFDQYFRRLQAHGLARLIVWLSPFPYITDPSNYPKEDWERYEAQARAIIDSEELGEVLKGRKRMTCWAWLRQLLALRLRRDFGALFSQSAVDHGIALSVSFRPFEAALTKYYEVPAFDAEGNFLWSFMPLASPAVTYHADRVCFAHYRRVLAEMGHGDCGELDTIEIAEPDHAAEFLDRYRAHGDNLRIAASPFPPLQDDSFVLQRQSGDSFKLRRYEEIRQDVEARLHVLTSYNVETDEDGSLRISGLSIPDEYRFLVLTNPARCDEAIDMDAHHPVTLWSKEGTPLGRENVYWVLDDSDEQRKATRVAGIPADAQYYSEFNAMEKSIGFTYAGPPRRPLADGALVIDRGAPWSVEMIDFNRPAAREYVVADLKTVLSYPAFDEIFINTRTHTQLAAGTGDGVLGIQPIARYRKEGKNYFHLGIDRSYAPLSVAEDAQLRELASDPTSVTKITTWQPGEWQETCQSPDSPYRWRYARNRAVAAGLRRLLQDLEQHFPGVRTRVVMPEREAATRVVKDGLDEMASPEGGPYGRDYYRHLWATINHIPSIGEGMAMVDLSGLAAEPVFLGTRFMPDQGPLDLFVRQCLVDMADNHGSSFRGPRSFFYEGHETLRAKDREAARRRREEIICYLLSFRKDIGEVILYEAARWTYDLPLSVPDLCSHGFLDRRDEILRSIKER